MKKMILIMLVIFSSHTFAQEDQNVKAFVQRVIKTLKNQDSDELTAFIDPEEGFYLMRVIGSYDYWDEGLVGICLTKDCLDEHPKRSIGLPSEWLTKIDFSGVDQLPIYFDNDLNFECEDISKQGVFIADFDQGKILSEAMQLLIENELVEKSKTTAELVRARAFEQESRRVVINTVKHTFVFYITLKKGKWYLGMIDFASMDCSV